MENKVHCALIAFDLDNTLLDREKRISADNLAALRQAAEKGIYTVPATGRILPGLPHELKTLPGIRCAILANGASVWDLEKGRELCSAGIAPELAVRIYDYLDNYDVIYDCYKNNWGYMSLRFYQKAGRYIPNGAILDMLYNLRTPVPELKRYLLRTGGDIQKISVFCADMALREELLRSLTEEFPEIAVTTSLYFNIELNSRAATKGRALAALCKKLGVPIEESIAFGDDSNDLDMLAAAGLGIAMENAKDAVKAVSDLTAPDCNDSGVAKMLKTLGII